MLGPTEFDVTGTAGWASEQTPVFELLSFGGEQTVRGLRRDDILGLRLWSIQPEIWTPVPGVGDATQGVGAFLRQNMRLAFFSDFGGVYKTLGPLQGAKVGPGAGIRVHYGLIVLKLDWAKGFGDAATKAKWGRLYFSVMTTRAF
jgi:hemolysin activation/secretion protein